MPLLGFELSRTAADPLASCLAGGKPGTARFFSAALAAGDYARHRPSLQHLALRMRSRAAGQTVYETVQAMGSPVLAPPPAYPQSLPHSYAVFWEGPEGCMVEAVCLRAASSVSRRNRSRPTPETARAVPLSSLHASRERSSEAEESGWRERGKSALSCRSDGHGAWCCLAADACRPCSRPVAILPDRVTRVSYHGWHASVSSWGLPQRVSPVCISPRPVGLTRGSTSRTFSHRTGPENTERSV